MRNLLNPKWLLIINTVPTIVLFVLFIGEFNVIKTLLAEENISLWTIFSIILGTLGVLNLSYSAYLIFRKKEISIFYGVAALLCYIPFLYLFEYHIDKIIPFNIPQWMYSGNSVIYAITFLMPTLIYSIFVFVLHFTPENKDHKASRNFLFAIIVPILFYLFFQVIMPLWKPVEGNFGIHTTLIFVIAGTLVFLFFVIRAVYILATKKNHIWQKYQLAWKIPISILLPLVGLAVNNGQFLSSFVSNDAGVFGDFKSYWFYALAFVNGIFICLPNLKNKLYRILLFVGRSITFSYTLYFFLVFLPFLPLSIIAIIAIGTGFLMLTPLLLFVLHVNELSKDITFLHKSFSRSTILLVSFCCVMVIPVSITFKYLNDRSVLNETLNYIYSPDYSKTYKIDKSSLQNTLNVVSYYKDNNNQTLLGSQIPYLSSYFNWLVLDNLTLSDAKINSLEKIFWDKTSFKLSPEISTNDNVQITNISTKSTYDKAQHVWVSWIDLEMTNNTNSDQPSEYKTTFELPDGCWISDYYLYVGKKKKMGILAEKKSAMWVFSNIRNENKDPGILYYLTGNKVAFRVFPFAKNEVRKTGIELLHRELIKLTLDNRVIELGKPDSIQNVGFENKVVVYVSSQQKQTLKKVQRRPYYHFIVDVSTGIEKYSNEFIKRIEKLTEKDKSLAENAQISFVNSYVTTYPYDNEWKQHFKSQVFEGGFYLDRAIKTILVNSYKEKSNTFPVIIVVTDSIQNAVLDKDFSDLKMTFPDNNLFFCLNDKGNLEPHSLMTKPSESVTDTLSNYNGKTVLEYKFNDNAVSYLPDNNKPTILLRSDIFETSENEIKDKNWESALIMQAKWTSQILHPETSDKEWLRLVKYSFMSKVMTPVTSYLVVENEAQKAALLKKQKQVLSSNKSLDLGEDTQRMSEPGLVLMAILFGFALWIKEKRKKTKYSC